MIEIKKRNGKWEAYWDGALQCWGDTFVECLEILKDYSEEIEMES